MNNASLKPMEPAARILCVKLGVDPDELVEDPHPTLFGVSTPGRPGRARGAPRSSPAWMLTSLKEAGDQVKVH